MLLKNNLLSSYGIYRHFYRKCWHPVRCLCIDSVSTMTMSTAKDERKTAYRTVTPSFIINKDTANFFIKCLRKDLNSNDVIVEIDPGKGILTKKIMEDLDNKLLVFRPSKELKDELKNLYPNKFDDLAISELNFYDFYKYFYENSVYLLPDRHNQFIQDLQIHSNDSSNLNIVGTVGSKTFFYSLLFDYTHRGTLYHGHLNPTFYLFVPYSIYAALMRKCERIILLRMGIPFSLYFDVTFLGASSQLGFKSFNWKKNYLFKTCPKGFDNFYLLKLSPKDLSSVLNRTGEKQLLEFHYFVSYSLRMNTNLSFINGLENLIPNCGEEFIKNGFRTFDLGFNLSNDQWFKAFQLFKQHADYNSIRTWMNSSWRVGDTVNKTMYISKGKFGFESDSAEDSDEDEELMDEM